MAKIKNAYKSKTVIFGALLTAAGAIQTALPELQVLLDPTTFGIVTSIVGVTVIVLRFVTSTGLDTK